jgi:hypothetical protein
MDESWPVVALTKRSGCGMWNRAAIEQLYMNIKPE